MDRHLKKNLQRRLQQFRIEELKRKQDVRPSSSEAVALVKTRLPKLIVPLIKVNMF